MDAKQETSLEQQQTLRDMEFSPSARGLVRRPLPPPGVEGLIASLNEFTGCERIEAWVPAQRREYAEQLVPQLVHVGNLDRVVIAKGSVKFFMSSVDVKDGDRRLERKDTETLEIDLKHVSCEFHNGTRGLTIMGDFLRGGVDWVTMGEPETW